MSEQMRFQNLAIGQITDPAYAMRTEIDQDALLDLAKSIGQVGLIEPIVVKQKGEKFEVIAGHRRFMACQLAQIAFVSCKIVEVTDEMSEALKIHENLFREDVNIVDEAMFIDQAMVQLKKSMEEIADMMGKSQSYVFTRLAILNYPEYLKEPLREGKIKFAVARALYKITDEKVLKDYVFYAVQNGCTEDMAKEWARKWRAEKQQEPGEEYVPIQERESILEAPTLSVRDFITGEQIPMREAVVAYMSRETFEKLTRG